MSCVWEGERDRSGLVSRGRAGWRSAVLGDPGGGRGSLQRQSSPQAELPFPPGVPASSDVRRIDLWLFPADGARVLSLCLAHNFRRTVQRLWEVLSLPSVRLPGLMVTCVSCGASARTPPVLRTSPGRGWGPPASSSAVLILTPQGGHSDPLLQMGRGAEMPRRLA